MSSLESQETLQQIMNDFDKIPRSRFYQLYGKYIYYGLENEDYIDYARALYYFKLAADLGDVRAHFYVSLMTYLNLDGSYSIYRNSPSQSQLYRYVKEKYMSVSLVDLYFSAIQGDQYASVAMGFRHLFGIGVSKNCSNAALFYLPVLERVADEPKYAKYVSDSKYVAKAIYDGNFYMNHELDIFGHAQIFENLNQITYESVGQVKQLAQSFYYGLNGLERDYNKAYQLYLKMYEQLNDKESGIKVAQMNIEEIVPPDYQLANQILNSIETKNTELQGKLYNCLGYIYYKGLGVARNVVKAQDFFRKSADLQNSDGMFNLGSMLMLPSTFGRERNQKHGVNLIQKAASLGHSMAQYSLALILLDGVDIFQSCDLAASLLHSSATRGPWADTLKTANYLFQQERYPQSLAKYFEAGYTGFIAAIQNAAVIIEQNEALYFDSLHFSDIQSRLEKDPIYQLIGKQHDAFSYLFSDYLKFVNKTQLHELLQSDSFYLGGALQLRLLQFCSDQKEAICQMKLGDYYYNGKYEEIDYKKSIQLYKKALQGQLIDAMKAHVYFNLGLMIALGQGTNINRTRSIEYFELSITSYSIIPILPISAQVQILDYCVNVYRQIDQLGFDQFVQINYVDFALQTLNNAEEYIIERSQTIVNFIIASVIVILFGLRLKLINKQY